MDIGKQIKELRKHRNISQVDLAARVGVSQTSLSLIETGENNPSEKTVKEISKVLRIPVPILYFLSFSEDDVPIEKRALYKSLSPHIKGLVQELFSLD